MWRAIYPDEPTALHSGFTGYLELDGAAGERVNFDIWARLDDGRSIRLFQRGLSHACAGQGESLLRSALRQVMQRPADSALARAPG